MAESVDEIMIIENMYTKTTHLTEMAVKTTWSMMAASDQSNINCLLMAASKKPL